MAERPVMAVFHDHVTGYIRVGPLDGSPLTIDDALALVHLANGGTVERCAHWLTGQAVGIPLLLDLRCAREAGHPRGHVNGGETWNDTAGEWRRPDGSDR